ncbi:MAG: GTP cyclohydrolase I FolE [Alphaproteobacteria bacterium]
MSDHKVDRARVQTIVGELLVALGEDPTREGILDTPRRVADWWTEFLDYDPGKTGTVFTGTDTDQMVVVSGMRIWSLCEHHLLPFWCDVSIGYIATNKVIGLSKMGRIAHKHAHKLNLQEGLVHGIAEDLAEIVGQDVAVIATGEHLCMTMRGIQTPHRMTSSSMKGKFKDHAETRAEFMAIVRGAQ